MFVLWYIHTQTHSHIYSGASLTRDTIHSGASYSGRFCLGTKYMKIYQMWFIYPEISVNQTIILRTKVSELTSSHCIYVCLVTNISKPPPPLSLSPSVNGTKCVVKHKCPRTKQISKAVVIVKTQDQSQNVKI
jgi:hypothetical protein